MTHCMVLGLLNSVSQGASHSRDSAGVAGIVFHKFTVACSYSYQLIIILLVFFAAEHFCLKLGLLRFIWSCQYISKTKFLVWC